MVLVGIGLGTLTLVVIVFRGLVSVIASALELMGIPEPTWPMSIAEALELMGIPQETLPLTITDKPLLHLFVTPDWPNLGNYMIFFVMVLSGVIVYLTVGQRIRQRARAAIQALRTTT